MTSLKAFTSPIANTDKSKLIISNIPENINIQHLELYINLLTNKNEIKEINWSLDFKGKLLIEFAKEIDIGKILDDFNSNGYNNLNGRLLQLEQVSLTRTIVVLIKDAKAKRSPTSLGVEEEEEYRPESIPVTTDLLDLYFVNKQRSGGGEVESIERKSSRYWLITMKEQQVIREILAKKHVIDEKPIKIFPHFENFGLPYLFRPIFDEYYTSVGAGVVFRLKIKGGYLLYFFIVRGAHTNVTLKYASRIH